MAVANNGPFWIIFRCKLTTMRKQLIYRALIDAALSMLVAFTLAIMLVNYNHITLAMVVLILFLLAPFIHILRNRRIIK
jgi:hypothetical protein